MIVILSCYVNLTISQINYYDNYNNFETSFLLYSSVYSSNDIGPGVGVLMNPFDAIYAGLIIWQNEKDDIVTVAIYLSTDCGSDVVVSTSNKLATTIISPFNNYNTMYFGVDSIWFQNYGAGDPIISNTTITSCGTPTFNVVSIVNAYQASIKVVICDIYGNSYINKTIIPKGGYSGNVITLGEGSVINILASDGTYLFGGIFYNSNQLNYRGHSNPDVNYFLPLSSTSYTLIYSLSDLQFVSS